MQYIHYQDIDPARHLACDEALLNMAEEGHIGETLRIYEMTRPTVVLGIQDEYRRAANVENCRRYNVPVLRRRSGGGAVLLASGCLVYSAVLDREQRNLNSVPGSYRWINGNLCEKLSTNRVKIHPAGISDLSWNERKVGGSSQQRKKRYLLHHGTLLYNMNVTLIEQFIGEAQHPPAYRKRRSHLDFVANLPLKRNLLVRAMEEAFGRISHGSRLPDDLATRIERLVCNRYGCKEWTQRR
jgi:lipoate-protein ligase A